MITTLVTGGTGFLGSEIVRQLIRGKETVRVLCRNPLTVGSRNRTAGTEFAQGNIFDPPSLKQALAGCDALVIATQFDNSPFEDPRRGLTFMKVDGEGTELQVAAAKEAGVKRIIYMSGAGAREGRAESWFQAKARAEKTVRESGLNWTVIRPSWVYGPGDRSLNKFAMFARVLPFVPIIGMGNGKIQPVFVGDVAEVVAKSLNNPNTYGKIFEIGGPQELSMREITKTLLRVMEKHRMILPQPKSLMKLIAAFVQYLPGRPLTPAGIDFVTMEERVDNSLLTQTLGLKLTALEAGLATYLGAKKDSIAEVLRRHAA